MPTTLQILGACLFALAVLHTLSTRQFERLAHTHPAHAGVWHLLGEVEVVFGFWAMVLILDMAALGGWGEAVAYLESCNFTEPMFVFAIMVMAATRPVLDLAAKAVQALARCLPLPGVMPTYMVLLSVVPLLGSFITEPAAMTLAALMLRDTVFSRGVSLKLQYTTLAVLFVNVSIGGTLTPFAAPPVLMVAATWQWDTLFMLMHFGWKAAVAVGVNAIGATWWLRHELAGMQKVSPPNADPVPASVVAMHLLFLVGVVVFAHHPVVFMGLFLFFMGFTAAYPRHQSPLILREALLVAFFLAGLVVLGRMQAWWLRPLLSGLDANAVFFGATALTAVTDNAALTYLGSLLDAPSHDFKVALVAGAVSGGGLTLIANAPNPAGAAILKPHFEDGAISPLNLFLFALPPTAIAITALRYV